MRRPRRLIAAAAGALALVAAVPAFAAGLNVVSARLTIWQSATTVPVCAGTSTQTAYAPGADHQRRVV